MMGHLLPTTADTTAPTVTWLRPGDGATVNAADPVEIEVEAVDERGDLKEVRLSVGGTQVAQEGLLPVPDALAADRRRRRRHGDAVGRRVEDKAGNVTTSTRTITVGAASAMEESPLPTGVTTISGKPVVGETLTCVPSGFSGNGVDITLRVAARRHRDRRRRPAATYVPVDADIGHDVGCRVTATNSAGDADSTSDALTVSSASEGPQGRPDGSRPVRTGPTGPTGPTAPTGPHGSDRPDRPDGSDRPHGSAGPAGSDAVVHGQLREGQDQHDRLRGGPHGLLRQGDRVGPQGRDEQDGQAQRPRPAGRAAEVRQAAPRQGARGGPLPQRVGQRARVVLRLGKTVRVGAKR